MDEIKPLAPTAEERRAQMVNQVIEDPEYKKYLLKLDPKKKRRVQSSNNRMRTGLHTVAPLTCLGPNRCPFLEHCPIPERAEDGEIIYGKMSDYPVYRSCVMERLYMEQKVVDYLQHLQIDPLNPVEVALVNDLAVLDLYKNRALMVLSSGDRDGDGRDLLKVNVSGFNDNGNGNENREPQTSTQIHPAATFIDQLERRRRSC